MAVLRLQRPLWLRARSAADTRTYPQLSSAVRVDVAILGGGVTGAIAAWRLAAAGVRVAVLEAGRVGRGSTAASTALLMQEPDEDFSALRARYGTRATKRIWSLSRSATRDLIGTLRRLDISCGLQVRDSIYFTLDEDAGDLRLEHRSRQQSGISSRWLDAASLRRVTGIAGAGAIRTQGNAQVDPYRACLGFLHAAERFGATIYERSFAGRAELGRGGALLKTARGSVQAAHVVVATGYATPEFRPLGERFRMLQTYVVATEPLSSKTRRSLGLSDVMLWDTGRPYHYARWTMDGRLLLGGGDRPAVGGQRRIAAFRAGVANVRDYFQQLYPSLKHVRTQAWEGLFATTPDGLPYIGTHRRYPRHLFALGYGGNGMTFGFLASRLLLEQLSGSPSDDHELFAFGRTRRARL
jgi:glycine/D-amino acid oxidase-like deaminating enzyme